MPTLDDARHRAEAWCDDWNRRDLDAIMGHYAEIVAFSSPAVVAQSGHADGWLRGRSVLRSHFARALETPGLRFTLQDVLVGNGTMCVLYRRETGLLACDTVEFDAAFQATRVVTCYAEMLAPAMSSTTIPPTVETPPEIREVSVEADLARTPTAVWAFLTRPALIARWLMANDFAPVVGHRFMFEAPATASWDGVVRCEVLEVEVNHRLSYRWGIRGQGGALETIVTWTLADAAAGTRLRFVHAGFHTPANDAAYVAMYPDWHAMFARIERLARGAG